MWIRSIVGFGDYFGEKVILFRHWIDRRMYLDAQGPFLAPLFFDFGIGESIMSATAYWPEAIRTRSARLDLSQNQLALFSGVHQAKLSRGLAGLEPLSNETIERIDEALCALENLVQLIPFPIDLRRIDYVKDLLGKVKTGDLGSVVILPKSEKSEILLREAERLSTPVQI